MKISEKLCRWNDIRRLETKRATIQITHWTHTLSTTPWRRYATSESIIRLTTSALNKIGWHGNIEKCLTNLELLIQPLDPKLNDFNEDKNNFYDNNDATTATEQMLMLQSQRIGQIWAWTGSEQFVSFLCDCDFLFSQELTCKRLFRCIRQRETKDQFMAPQWLRESWTTTVPTLTIKQHFHRFMKLEATPNLQNKSPQWRLDRQQAPKIQKPKEIDPLSSGENESLFSVKTLMEKDTSENSMILLKSLKPQKPEKRW